MRSRTLLKNGPKNENFEKFFCVQKKSIGANLIGIDMCVKKLVFSSKIEMGVWQFCVQGGVTPKTDVTPTYQAQR